MAEFSLVLGLYVKFEGEGGEIQFQNGLRKGSLLNMNVHFLSSQVKEKNLLLRFCVLSWLQKIWEWQLWSSKIVGVILKEEDDIFALFKMRGNNTKNVEEKSALYHNL